MVAEIRHAADRAPARPSRRRCGVASLQRLVHRRLEQDREIGAREREGAADHLHARHAARVGTGGAERIDRQVVEGAGSVRVIPRYREPAVVPAEQCLNGRIAAQLALITSRDGVPVAVTAGRAVASSEFVQDRRADLVEACT